ncbi:DNA sulfur modification protein DndB [Streptomyces albidoflavus]|uniref:DNA sulfur modification protein DndB n=1 Tax=Streptomyces albidoflavus TaxID=1886 RepID=UPI0021D58047|nr:DNA sulfur modification protein DndB [Streptomyces albidoflavus]MCU7707119.1 DNA sulfur modification protein DndB [Streptomyces albidoflavus]
MRLQIPGIGYKQGGRQMVTTAMNPVALIKTVSKPEPWNPVGNQPHGNRPRDESHVKGITEYLETEEHFVIGAVVLYASPKEAEFTPMKINGVSQDEDSTCFGILSLDIGATFDIGDGQHRIGAYEQVIQSHDEEGDNVMDRLRASGQPVVVVIDDNQLHRAQDFADLQRNVKTLASSIGMSMDRRKAINRAMLTLFQDTELPIFGHAGSADRVEFLKDSPGKLSAKLWSFKTIRYASGTALVGVGQRSTTSWEKAVDAHLEGNPDEARAMLKDLWAGLSELTPYADVIDNSITAKELREKTYLTSAGVLYAIGYAVFRAVHEHGMDVRTAVKGLDNVDFTRTAKTTKITQKDTIFAGNLVDPDSGKIAAGRAAWESAAEALLSQMISAATT